MRTALCKVTTWLSKLLIKKTKNTTNNLFYYLYFVLSSSQNMRKDGYTKNSVGEIGSTLTKPSLSQYENNIRKESYFQGNHSRDRSSPSNSFGAPRRLVTLGRLIAQKKRCQTSSRAVEDPTTRSERRSPRISYLETIVDTPKYVGWEKSSQLAQKQLRKFSDHFGASSENVGDI